MNRDKNINYKKAEADLYDLGAYEPEEIYGRRSEKSFRRHMKEHGLNPDRYIKSDGDKKPSGSTNGGCYLTSACTAARKLPDDCMELQTLRAFRDGYLAALPEGRDEIDRYYRIAPAIVDGIDRQRDRAEIWDRVYADLVGPCVRMILARENEDAYRHYKACSMGLYRKYGMPALQE